jgi:hypothetical protein
MKKIAVYAGFLVIALILLSAAIMGCSSKTTSPSPATTLPAQTGLDIQAIRAYADPATETTLQGLSESNLAKYTQYASNEFKAALTQDQFNKVAAQINAQYGSFVSIEFLRAEETQGYIVVHYKARYAKGEIGVRMVFDTNHQIAGQWFE